MHIQTLQLQSALTIRIKDFQNSENVNRLLPALKIILSEPYIYISLVTKETSGRGFG